MNYKLAKELKDSGFEYKQKYTSYRELTINPEAEEEVCIEPTLSELIENCIGIGRSFNLSYRKENLQWKATSYYATSINAEGKTPEIAVANLYLNLNKNNE